MNHPRGTLHRLLRRVRARRRLLAWVATAAATCAVASAAVLAASAARAAGVPAPAVPWLLGLPALVGSGALVARLLIAPYARTRDDLRVARAVDALVPEAGDALGTAIALDRGEAGPAGDADGAELARLAREQAARAALAVDAGRLLPWRGIRRPAWAGLAGGAAFGIAALIWPESLAEGARALLGGGAGSSDGQAAAPPEEAGDEADFPISDVTVDLVPPAYTGLPATRLEGSTGDLEALPGTQVRVRARLPGGAADPQWTLGEAGPFAAESGENGAVSVALTVPQASTTWRLLARLGPRRAERRTRAMRVDVVADSPPTLQVAGPAGPLEMRPEEGVRAGIRSEDDHGLSRVDRVVLRSGAEVSRRTLARWEDRTRRVEIEDEFTPGADPALAEGGEFDVVVESWDNDTVSGPKVTRSAPLRVHVLTPEDHHRQVLALKERLKETLIGLLGDHLEQHDDGWRGLDFEGAIQRHARNREQATAAFRTGAALLGAVREDSMERDLSVAQIGATLDALARTWDSLDGTFEREILSAGTLPRSGGPAGLLSKQADLIAELERAVLALDRLMGEQVMDELLTRTRRARESMDDLMKALDAARGGKGDKAALEKALKEIQRQVAEMARLQTQAREGPGDEYVNPELDEARRLDLDGIRELIEQGRFAEAAERMKAMSELMAKAEGNLEEMGAGTGGRDGREQMERLERLAEKARDLERGQEEVMRRTDEVRRRFGEATPEAALQQAERRLAELGEKLSELSEGAGGVEESLRRAVTARVRRARDSVRRAREAAGRGDGAGARGEARASLDELADADSLLDSFGQDGRMGAASPSGRNVASQLDQAVADNREILEMLEGEGSRERERRAQAAEAGTGAASGQRSLKDRVAGLRQEMEGASQAPLMDGARGRQRLDDAGRLMESAAGDLEEGSPRRSGRSQEQALDQLREFRRDVETARDEVARAMRRGGGSRGGGAARYGSYFDGQWGRTDGDDVELPRPEEFLGPEEFRRAVMEGATEDAPEAYRRLNGEYYEELVR